MSVRANAGFSLLELLVVLVIAALLTSIAVPRIGAVLPSMRADGFAREVAASLREARSRAVTRNREIGFVFDGSAGRYGAGDGIGGLLPEGIAVVLTTGTSEVSGASRGAIRFFPDGSSTGGRIQIGAGDNRRVVSVDWLTGGIRVEG